MQTSYSYSKERGYHGQRIESYPSAQSVGVLTGAANIGDIVSYDDATVVKGVKVPAAAGDVAALKVAGILLYVSMREPGALAAGDAHQVLKKGRVLVYCETACTAHTTAFVRHTANGALAPGALRNNVDTAAAVAVAGITFMETRTTAGLVLVEFDL